MSKVNGSLPVHCNLTEHFQCLVGSSKLSVNQDGGRPTATHSNRGTCMCMFAVMPKVHLQ